MKILIVEDDDAVAKSVSAALSQASFVVERCTAGLEAQNALERRAYDAVVLDLALPDIDGTEVLKKIRGEGNTTPVLVLTAKDSVESLVNGFELGADDYVTKPFDLIEVEARLRALIRRKHMAAGEEIRIGNLRFDTKGKRVFVREAPIDLGSRELEVLEILMLNAGRVVSKEQILQRISSLADELGTNAVEVYVHRLRKKITDSGLDLRTIRGLGYLLEAAA
jgi:two-component system OmpR family response regulator